MKITRNDLDETIIERISEMVKKDAVGNTRAMPRTADEVIASLTPLTLPMIKQEVADYYKPFVEEGESLDVDLSEQDVATIFMRE